DGGCGADRPWGLASAAQRPALGPRRRSRRARSRSDRARVADRRGHDDRAGPRPQRRDLDGGLLSPRPTRAAPPPAALRIVALPALGPAPPHARGAASEAAGAGAPRDADDAGYRAVVAEAIAEFAARRWAEARALFRRAQALSANARR